MVERSGVRPIRREREILERCTFSLDELRYQYPSETEPGETALEKLERLTWEGARRCYPDGIPDAVAATCRHELRLIEELGYAPYLGPAQDLFLIIR